MSNRNDEYSFTMSPQAYVQRSAFKGLSHSLKTSFNVGDLVPIFWKSVLPGDEFSVDTSKVCRLQTLITPMMGNIFLDTYWFFVPNRILWDHWEQFIGGKQESPWLPQVEYSEPQVNAVAVSGWNSGTIADYLGVPPGITGFSVSSLPFRAYGEIYNEWFRDENLQTMQAVTHGDSAYNGQNSDDTNIYNCVYGGYPMKANKIHDRFTSALPAPQRGPSVTLPIVGPAHVPVYTESGLNSHYASDSTSSYQDKLRAAYPLYLDNGNHVPIGGVASPVMPFGVNRSATDYGYMQTDKQGNANPYYLGATGDGSEGDPFVPLVGKTNAEFLSAAGAESLTPVNLIADFNPIMSTVSELRTAFQIQKFLERSARGGNRYIEIIKSMFGVTSPDGRLQRPEYLGGSRFPIRVYQQTASTSATNQPLGDVAAFSVTADKHHDFRKSFVEHGILMCLACARYEHEYQQGIDRDFSRKTRFDYYWPLFSNISEQPIFNREIYAQGTSADSEVFGYQEAWSDYRYMPSRVSGEMRSGVTNSLDAWHIADKYTSQPYLSAAWMKEDKSNVDRVLAVTSSTANQIFADIYFDILAIRPMPVYSIPGLIDHF